MFGTMGLSLLTAVFGLAPSVATGLTGSDAGADAAGAFWALPESLLAAVCETSFSLMISFMFLTGSKVDYGREVRVVVSYARKKIPVGCQTVRAIRQIQDRFGSPPLFAVTISQRSAQ
jgi:hypothetical protein